RVLFRSYRGPVVPGDLFYRIWGRILPPLCRLPVPHRCGHTLSGVYPGPPTGGPTPPEHPSDRNRKNVLGRRSPERVFPSRRPAWHRPDLHIGYYRKLHSVSGRSREAVQPAAQSEKNRNSLPSLYFVVYPT